MRTTHGSPSPGGVSLWFTPSRPSNRSRRNEGQENPMAFPIFPEGRFLVPDHIVRETNGVYVLIDRERANWICPNRNPCAREAPRGLGRDQLRVQHGVQALLHLREGGGRPQAHREGRAARDDGRVPRARRGGPPPDRGGGAAPGGPGRPERGGGAPLAADLVQPGDPP